MLAKNEDELICDMAETYHIYDMRALPVKTLAVLACGLSESSRVARKKAGQRLPINELLQCAIVDRIGQLVWMQSKDGAKGVNRPKLILEALEMSGPGRDESAGYSSPAEFEAARRRIIGG